jgi:hypothetical protein
MRSMVIVVPEFSTNTTVRYVAVSLPLVPALLDHAKYLEPQDMPPPETRSRDLLRLRQGRATPRAPSLRTLVRWAQKCDTAEQLGEQLRRRYDRQRQRAGLAQADRRRTDLAEVAERLDQLLVD